MAEPLKSYFGPEIPRRIGEMILRVHPGFDAEGFVALALDGFEGLELMDRGRRISAALADTLPTDRAQAIRIIVDSLGSVGSETKLTGMGAFLYLPYVFFVAEQGLECFEVSMGAQYELTQRFTAEFSIRAFIDRYPARTMERLRKWAADPNVHVRRLVSEGTRPRLPWAPRLKRFQEDPRPVIELLELLKDDPEEYVRRSVANNLNDISKDHPQLVVGVAARWWEGAGENRRRLVRHALRTLVKKGDASALEVLGFEAASPIRVMGVRCEPGRLEIGGKVQIRIELFNPSGVETRVLADLRVHFIKADGSSNPKVFKGSEVRLKPNGTATVRKTVSVAQHSTRRHYPGTHVVEVMVNGVNHPGASFELI